MPDGNHKKPAPRRAFFAGRPDGALQRRDRELSGASSLYMQGPLNHGGCMNYVDGMVIPVPQKNLAAYKRMSRKCGSIWREHGALAYTECVADDVKPGKVTSFPQAVKLKSGEVVVFSWIVFKSRKDRNRINKKVMSDPRLASMMNPKALPFDGKRMFWGGFKPIVKL
jgi:uncharacterized protein YbaA (DUF1428 family)